MVYGQYGCYKILNIEGMDLRREIYYYAAEVEKYYDEDFDIPEGHRVIINFSLNLYEGHREFDVIDHFLHEGLPLLDCSGNDKKYCAFIKYADGESLHHYRN